MTETDATWDVPEAEPEPEDEPEARGRANEERTAGGLIRAARPRKGVRPLAVVGVGKDRRYLYPAP